MKFTLVGLVVAAVWYGVSDGRSSSASLAGRSEVARGSGAATRQERWSWKGRIAAGRTIAIHGINGDVSAEPASGTEVEVLADKHGRRNEPEEIRMEVVEHDGGVTICALYPSSRSREATCSSEGMQHSNVRNNDVQVDFVVRVPRGVHFEGNTVNGDVEAMNLDGDVDVSTVNGGARLETNGGEARASSVNGGVTAVVRALGERGLKFSTVNGGITVTLPAGLSVDLDAETVNGSITSDFPISVQGRMTPRKLAGRIGQGGRMLDLETVNGSIRIRQLP
jgi:hypothetical protein